MRRTIFGAGALALSLGATHAEAQESAWRPAGSNPMVAPSAAGRPAVSLGIPSVSLGVPRSATVVPVAAFGPQFRAKAEDTKQMPAGPALQGAPGPVPLHPPTPLAQPTPMGPPVLMPGQPDLGFIPGNPATNGPVTGGPVVSTPASGGAYDSSVGGCPGGCDGMAPLPGGVFVQDAQPCGYLLYGSAEYLYWTIRDSYVPTLLVQGNMLPPTTDGSNATGPLGGETVLIGGNSVAQQERSGARFTLGGWFSRCQNWGIEGSYFFLARRGATFSAYDDTPLADPVLGRPFINTSNDRLVNNMLVPFNGPVRLTEVGLSSFTATTSNALWGAELNARKALLAGCRWRLDGLAGFRYLNFDENLKIAETINFNQPGGLGIMAMLEDNFSVENRFYGGQIGLKGELRRGCWTLDMTAKVALGTTNQVVTNSGGQRGMLIDNTVGAGGPVGRTTPFTGPGLLVQPTNMGQFTNNEFSVVPEVGINIGYQVTPNLRVFAGYSFLYWTNVLRVGDQVDTTLNVQDSLYVTNSGQTVAVPPTQFRGVGPARPTVPFTSTDFWAQGISVGLQFTW